MRRLFGSVMLVRKSAVVLLGLRWKSVDSRYEVAADPGP